jgi:hypothetical protein
VNPPTAAAVAWDHVFSRLSNQSVVIATMKTAVAQ